MADERRRTVTAEHAPKAAGPYSHAVAAGGLLFCSGQVPRDPATGAFVEGDIGAQTTQCMENLAAVCAAAGASLDDAVRCGIYVTDMGTFAQVNEAYGAFFPSDPPARSTVEVSGLPLGAQVEVDAVVVLPG